MDKHNFPIMHSDFTRTLISVFHGSRSRRGSGIDLHGFHNPLKIHSKSIQNPFRRAQAIFKIHSKSIQESIQNPFKIHSKSIRSDVSTQFFLHSFFSPTMRYFRSWPVGFRTQKHVVWSPRLVFRPNRVSVVQNPYKPSRSLLHTLLSATIGYPNSPGSTVKCNLQETKSTFKSGFRAGIG